MRYTLTSIAAFLMFLSASPTPLRASEIPLGTSGGIYTVPVQVNRSVTLQFLVDSGAGVVVIPEPVLESLVRNGTVTRDDVLGTGTAELADRSVYRAAQVRIRELRVGNTIVRDVIAAVSPGLSQPLLGQSFFSRFSYVTFDNQRHVLILPDGASAPIPQYPARVPLMPTYPPYR